MINRNLTYVVLLIFLLFVIIGTNTTHDKKLKPGDVVGPPKNDTKKLVPTTKNSINI